MGSRRSGPPSALHPLLTRHQRSLYTLAQCKGVAETGHRQRPLPLLPCPSNRLTQGPSRRSVLLNMGVGCRPPSV